MEPRSLVFMYTSEEEKEGMNLRDCQPIVGKQSVFEPAEGTRTANQ